MFQDREGSVRGAWAFRTRFRWFALDASVRLFTPLLLGCMAGCGGGGAGGSGGGGGGQTPDFTLSLSSSSLTVSGGASASFSVSITGVNGFSSNVALSLSGLPSGISSSPANLQATPGSTLQISLSAASSVTASTAKVTVSGSSGSLSHSATLTLTVKAAQQNGLLSRTRYIRTDAVTEYGFWLNENWMVFDPATKRFFVSDPFSNQVFVIDATKQSEIESIAVPGAYGLDETPDHTAIYVGTQVGDVYAIDPVAMTVTKRYLAAQIGDDGYITYAVRVLANGKLVLLGAQGGLPWVDGFGGFAIWDPADNSLAAYGAGNGTTQPDCVRNIGAFTLTGDRSLIVEGSIDSDGTLCTLDPNTGTWNETTTQGFLLNITTSPDGKSLFLASYNSVLEYDTRTLTQVASFPVVGDTASDASMIVSLDSTTLYMSGGSVIYAYDIATLNPKGWLPNLTVEPTSGGMAVDSIYGPVLAAFDGTGLLAGPMEEGVGFIDTTALRTGTPGTEFVNSYVTPATGPVAGGTAVEWDGGNNAAALPTAVYFGANTATNVANVSGNFTATTPSGSPGPVDIYSLTSDGGEQIVPEAFSYGPTILEASPNASTAEGGGAGILYGYGFGSTLNGAPTPTNLTITVGGKSASVSGFNGNAYGLLSPPFQLQSLAYTIPAGTAGSAADIQLTTSSGSTTVKGGMYYLPALQTYPLPGASLAQGIYDARRNIYYFTDANELQVFSLALGQWLSPIAVPAAAPGTTHRLWGVALSPDSSKLAVSDAGSNEIYLIDPDNTSSAQSFAMPQSCFSKVCGTENGVVTIPLGLAVSDSGMIYIGATPYGCDGCDGFLKLNTATGAFTDYGVYAEYSSQFRVAISSDNSRVFFNDEGQPLYVDTATDTLYFAPISDDCCYGDFDLSLSPNQIQFEATGYLYDTNLDSESYLVLNDREVLNTTYVYGVKLSPDGSLMFQPSLAGIDVFDGRLGLLRARIALPVELSQNFDALVSDGTDNVLLAIVDPTGDAIAVVDLSSLSEPAPLPYASKTPARVQWQRQQARHTLLPKSVRSASAAQASALNPVARIPHAANSILLRPKVK